MCHLWWLVYRLESYIREQCTWMLSALIEFRPRGPVDKWVWQMSFLAQSWPPASLACTYYLHEVMNTYMYACLHESMKHIITLYACTHTYIRAHCIHQVLCLNTYVHACKHSCIALSSEPVKNRGTTACMHAYTICASKHGYSDENLTSVQDSAWAPSDAFVSILPVGQVQTVAPGSDQKPATHYMRHPGQVSWAHTTGATIANTVMSWLITCEYGHVLIDKNASCPRR